MANPAPTINQINAFNATQGTTIDFNIIGGTELVRSNRIYIYDLSDNSLICTHLYASTESIHELPANTDSSIVYESGKSSADFVNGAQYYAQIQTYTDTAGTEGGSGLSVAKMFWCLDDPTLTITTIPSTISTTSYNVSATYDANTSAVSNIIQQYQFNLYSATGSLLQSSGVVVGSGTQQGTSTAYDISYNFSGLSVGSSYYVVVDVTTTQGMSVSAQSSTFTVSIDTPTLGEATVVNNACDGYISVTSNLSGEYGGSASGEIASFVTNSINDVSSLKVSLEPIQDLNGYDAPWVGGAGKNKCSLSDITFVQYIEKEIETIPIGTYVFSAVVTSTDADATECAVVFLDENQAVLASRPIARSVGGARVSTSFTVSAPIKYIRFYASNGYPSGTGDTATYADIMIESGSTATSFAPYENICPISGHTEVDVEHTGKNLSTYNEYPSIVPLWGGSIPELVDRINELPVGTYTISNKYRIESVPSNNIVQHGGFYITAMINGSQQPVNSYGVATDNSPTVGKVYAESKPLVITEENRGKINHCYYYCDSSVHTGTGRGTYKCYDIQIELGSTATEYEEYTGQSYNTPLGQTVYGGVLDLVSGVLTVKPYYASYNGETLIGEWESDRDEYVEGTTPTIGAQVVNIGADGTDYQLPPQQIQTLVGQNNAWSEQGEVWVTYNIPITNLLVKRQDIADVSGTWLTLYSQSITQASDMDFTFIDFTNQYGKTYKYALVPLLTQTQSGVEVEVEGGYTVSDEVQSIFDGVFIADQTGLQKCKANVGYGNVDMNQAVGTITPIGAKYPVVITNSKNQYHNGSISGTIVPDDYYFNGNLSRIDMVNKRNELEQFLTNKRAKIIKDWNSNIWLVMIMDNISCSFNNNYGMGMVSFNANWVEVGDPTNQQDLQATGLINVGGV